MTFENRGALGAAVAAAAFALAMFFYDRARRRQLTTRLGELAMIGRAMATSSPARRAWKAALLGSALVLACVALARPQVEGERAVELRGLDLVVAMDVSKSMLVDDVGATADMTAKSLDVSRLARARELANAVIDRLDGDRIAPVVFAGGAAHFPLTEDHVVAEQFLGDLGPADLPAGSNLSEALRVARCLLRPDLYDDLKCSRIARRGHGGDPLKGESLDPPDARRGSGSAASDDITTVQRGKAIAIFTDGADPTPEALEEVATARELGIAVFFVGVGTAKGGDVHDVDSFNRRMPALKHDRDGKVVHSARDDAGMTKLAEAGGDPARYVVAGEVGEVDPTPVVEALKAVDRGVTTKQVVEKTDVYQPFLFAAFVLLLVDAAISTRRRRRYPEEAS
nr:VWA domain-containing protein [Kofleriaceae bacterium]